MKDRSILELLELMRDNQGHFKTGLCGLSMSLCYRDIITTTESRNLRHHFDNSNPIRKGPYWYPSGQLATRIKWLNEQIEKLKAEQLTNNEV